MAEVLFKGNPVQTEGNLPEVGAPAPEFKGVATDLAELGLADVKGKNVLLNIFPSVDTGVCAMSVRKFYEQAQGIDNLMVVNLSLDLPFAHKRFCGAEGIENAVSVSDFRHQNVVKNYGLRMSGGPLAGLLARAVVVLNAEGKVTYTELVPEITQEPDYAAALAAVKA